MMTNFFFPLQSGLILIESFYFSFSCYSLIVFNFWYGFVILNDNTFLSWKSSFYSLSENWRKYL